MRCWQCREQRPLLRIKTPNGEQSVCLRCKGMYFPDIPAITQINKNAQHCPECARPLIIRKNRANGYNFWGCTGYPKCHYTRSTLGAIYRPSDHTPPVASEEETPNSEEQMARRFESEKVIAEFEKAFNIKREDMTPEQAMFLIKIIKHARVYCRNNSALYNWANLAFPALKFRTVKDTFTKRDGTTVPWDRLTIALKNPPKDVPSPVEVKEESDEE